MVPRSSHKGVTSFSLAWLPEKGVVMESRNLVAAAHILVLIALVRAPSLGLDLQMQDGRSLGDAVVVKMHRGTQIQIRSKCNWQNCTACRNGYYPHDCFGNYDISLFTPEDQLKIREKLGHHDPLNWEETVKRSTEEWQEKVEAMPTQQPAPPPTGGTLRLGYGTGFFITENGHIATAAHVVEGASVVKARIGGKLETAEILLKNTDRDVAILKVAVGGEPAPIANSAEVKTGQKVFTMGFPNPEDQGQDIKFTEGSISSLKGLEGRSWMFQISAEVQPGNSGGPLFDERGNVVGIISSTLNWRRMAAQFKPLPQNVNYAVKSEVLLKMGRQVPGLQKVLPKPNTKEIAKGEDRAAAGEESTVQIFVFLNE